MACVPDEVALDPVELHVGEVVRLDRVAQLRVDLLDLREHALRSRLLLFDLRRLCSRSAGCREDRNQTKQER